jgi:hypothetical protein
LLLGTPRLQPWVSQIQPEIRGFSPWGMSSYPEATSFSGR